MKSLVNFFHHMFNAFMELLELLLVGVEFSLDLFSRDCFSL